MGKWCNRHGVFSEGPCLDCEAMAREAKPVVDEPVGQLFGLPSTSDWVGTNLADAAAEKNPLPFWARREAKPVAFSAKAASTYKDYLDGVLKQPCDHGVTPETPNGRFDVMDHWAGVKCRDCGAELGFREVADLRYDALREARRLYLDLMKGKP